MSTDNNDEVNILRLSIHGVLIGYLAGFKNGRNVLNIADSFRKYVFLGWRTNEVFHEGKRWPP